MILIASFLVLVATVPLLGGRLTGLAHLQLRRVWILYAGFAVQLALIEVLPAGFPGSDLLHLSSYALAIVFLLANRQLPGLTLIVAGTVANLVAIGANGGVMPASPRALEIAGLSMDTDHFANSTEVAGARLAFLGDIWAVPKGFPLANVFSIGDVLLLIGGTVTVHVVSGSRLGRRIRPRWVPEGEAPQLVSTVAQDGSAGVAVNS